MAVRILVVGPAAERDALAELLRMYEHEVAVTTPAELADTARAWRPDLVIADASVPDLEGAEVIQALASISPRPRTILISPRPSHALARYGVTCLAKPLDVPRLLRETVLESAA